MPRFTKAGTPLINTLRILRQHLLKLNFITSVLALIAACNMKARIILYVSSPAMSSLRNISVDFTSNCSISSVVLTCRRSISTCQRRLYNSQISCGYLMVQTFLLRGYSTRERRVVNKYTSIGRKPSCST